MEVQSFTSGALATNNYLIWGEMSREAFLVDASGDIDVVQRVIEAEGLILKALLLTHAHFDHITGMEELLTLHPSLLVYQHESEGEFLRSARRNLSTFAQVPFVVTSPYDRRFLGEGDILDLAGASWQVWHVPGHSPGSLTFLCETAHLGFSGDLLFAEGGVGRSDLPHSNPDDLKRSLERLLTLPDDFVLYTGHGDQVSLGKEKALR